MAALYALLLQTFLVAATPVPASDGPAVLCAAHVPGAPAQDGAEAACHRCCTLVHAGNLAPAAPAAVAVPWPSTPFACLAWRPEADLPRTGPPAHAPSARGPPAV